MNTALLEKPKRQSAAGVKLEELSIPGYERVVKATEPKSGLVAIIVLHNTVLGPALGGTRILPYRSFEEGLEDALRLAKGMTYKSAVSEMGLGGGKSVIFAQEKTPELLQAFGRAVHALKGEYICAEDMGCGMEEVRQIRETTPYVVGLAHEKSSGDPAPFTAWGVLRGIESAARRLFGSDSLVGRRVAVQGVGNVGAKLVEYLFWAGADVTIADVQEARVAALVKRFGVKVVSPQDILQVSCDVLSPCAGGAIFNDATIPRLRCRAIAGAANNQLAEERHAEALRLKTILYAPDFVINAGGLLNVAAELEADGYTSTLPRDQVNRIYERLLSLYDIADRNGESTHAAAVALADYRLKYGIGKRLLAPVFHHSVE